jgi:DNA-binding HxlR family transcriptional regulator
MSTKRTYGDACGFAHGLDLVGERWALLVVRELLLGPKRFTDLRAGLANASPNVLVERLRELEKVGVVRRRKLPPPAGVWVYELTDWGRDLEPVVLELSRWAVRSPSFGGDAPVSADSSVLALRTMFEPDLAEDLSATYELRLGETHFRLRVADRRIEAARGSAEQPDAIIETAPGMLEEVAFHGRSLADAIKSGDVRIEGDGKLVTRLMALFSLPEPVPPAPASL